MKPHILIVDDDREIRAQMIRILRPRGYVLDFAADGEGCLATAQKETPDLVILDLGLPGEDGVTIIEKLRRIECTASIPILVVTGRNPALFASVIAENSVEGFFPKPIIAETFLPAVESVLAGNRAGVPGAGSQVSTIDSRKSGETASSFAKNPVAKNPVAKNPVAKNPVAKNPVASHPLPTGALSTMPLSTGPVVTSPVAKSPVAQNPNAKNPERATPPISPLLDEKVIEAIAQRVTSMVVEALGPLISGATSSSSPAVSVEPIVLEVEAGIEKLLPDYFSRRLADCERLNQSMEIGDFSTVEVIGHQMNGSGGGFGCPQVGEIGAALERGAYARDADAIRRQIAALRDFLARVQIRKKTAATR